MRNVSRKVVDKIKPYILYSITFLENRDVNEITWKNIVEPGKPKITIWRMCSAFWIPKVTNILS
jgi:hypothetical protein